MNKCANTIENVSIEQIENIIVDVIKTTPSRLEAAAHAVKIIASDAKMLTDYCLLSSLYDKIASELVISYKAVESRISNFHKDFKNSTSYFRIIMNMPYERCTSFIKENELVSLTYYVLSCI